MARELPNYDALPAAVLEFLSKASKDLSARKIDRLRLYPLILHAKPEDLIARRRRLFDFVSYELATYGYEVCFRRRLKRSKNHPDGKECAGLFHLLFLSKSVMLVASSLTGDDYRSGPARFTGKAYPLARRPFFPSTTLVRRIVQFAQDRSSTPIAVDTWGYHKESRRPRRDLERQSPEQAAREMAEQGRLVHKMLISLQRDSREHARLSFDRHGALTMQKGNLLAAVEEMLLPAIAEAVATDKTYEVVRTPEPVRQESVELQFEQDPFDSYEGMHALCDSVRQGDGLNLSVVHLNPYLHAQILDFYTGSAVEMLVTDSRSVSLVPRSAGCEASLHRIATTIYSHFAEGKSRRAKLYEEIRG